jgi:RHS repeat-associated protein
MTPGWYSHLDSFEYDPLGQRIEKCSSSGTTIYDGDNAVETVNATGGVVARYTTLGPSIDEPLAEVRSGITSYYEADGLGSVTSLSNSSGALVNTYTYDSFGNLTATTGTIVNPIRYTAREFDSETNLYFDRARYYDPTVGRFMSEDPLQSLTGPNFYAYVGNSPINFVDPEGKCPDDRTKEVNKCAAALADTLSLASLLHISPNNFWGRGLAGNDVSTISDMITHTNFSDSLANFLASNPTPVNLTSILIKMGMDAPIGVERAVLGVNGAGTTSVKAWIKDAFSLTVPGKLVSGALNVVQRGKLLYDAGTYVGALTVCAEQ